MNIGKICKHNVITAVESDELTAAAELMREGHVGYLVVVAPGPAGTRGKPIGVLTDRDIVVSVVSKQTDPRSLRVGDVMTRQLVVVEEGLAVSSALVKMRDHGVRRLPVVAADGYLVGVLSLDEVLGFFSDGLRDVADAIRNEQRIEGVLRP